MCFPSTGSNINFCYRDKNQLRQGLAEGKLILSDVSDNVSAFDVID
jgi:hypothetical protein